MPKPLYFKHDFWYLWKFFGVLNNIYFKFHIFFGEWIFDHVYLCYSFN
jgi:hypothetical protein